MSTTSFEAALAFLPERTAHPAARMSFLGRVLAFVEALRDGHRAASDYEHLIARGVPHAEAARQVFADHITG